tara:strand:+ start:397 stop:594 length:198 start_codon:yes stop_codon:yes gene_type:complete
MISTKDLRHHQMLAAIRENNIPETELKYLGKINDEHMYLIADEHIVRLDQIVDFEEVDDSEGDPV